MTLLNPTQTQSALKKRFNVKRISLSRLLAWIILIVMLTITVFPLLFMTKTSFVPAEDLYTSANQLVPDNPTLVHYKKVFGLLDTDESIAAGGSGANINFGLSLVNSLIFTISIVIVQTFNSAMAAYAFARVPFYGSRVLFGAFVASMMIPGVVTLIPNFVMVRDLGLLNTHLGMVAPFLLMHGFAVFFMRQFFISMPKDLEEAAQLDGLNPLMIFFKIALPLSIGPLLTVATLTMINMWNEFLWPFLVTTEDSMKTLPVALQSFKSQAPQGQPDWGGLMAATVVATLPTLGMLLAFGGRIVESVQFTGGK
ncbi:carbohydrate ABC transporter permease [Reinekea blandensis]|uniref:Putative binding-protein-dependent transport protein n=1 Tax=Reinekea blandensis MED297 TaxID=314283 RepID=A4BGH6_9GAMM|nr:carbohydrate ABC transporter permease [Reinekea blandensis]EAR08782.1 putative binding-protein-dependent transport protein [Reinekea sp. MED297] [Reinekea blandensis MED297]